MLQKTVEKIHAQMNYTPHSNEWNIANQLIDILHVLPESQAEMVLHDLDMKEMALSKMVKSITGARLCDPVKVMQKICDFYKITVPDELPPEMWRTKKAEPKSKIISMLDLL